MPLYEMLGGALTRVPQTTFKELGILERADIQRSVRSHIGAITPGVSTMVLAEEFANWEGAKRRIDLLCLDSDSRIVVVELKRHDAAHMELQAVRYAAMVSTMRFDQAVEAHRVYLQSIGSPDDPEVAIRRFLDVTADEPVALSEDVRIVLAATDFPTELTTAVLWLNKQGLDIRCVQMQPHLVQEKILVDVQQLIPLPSADGYQIAVRKKTLEQQVAKERSKKDLTKFELSIGDVSFVNLSKRRLIYEVVAEAIRRNVSPQSIASAISWRGANLWVCAEGNLNEEAFTKALPGRSLDRYFAAESDLLRFAGKTYALSNQWGPQTLEAVANVIDLAPRGPAIEWSATTPIVDEVIYGAYFLRQRSSGTIEVEYDGLPMQPVKPILRTLAGELSVSIYNGAHNEMNTRQLGAQVIKAINALK